MSGEYLALTITFLLLWGVTTQEKGYLYSFTGEDVIKVVADACLIAGAPVEHGQLLHSLTQIFASDDDKVKFGFIDVDTFKWPHKESLLFGDSDGFRNINNLKDSLVLFKKIPKDRKCLIAPNIYKTPQFEIYSGQMRAEIVTSFINGHCGTFRRAPDGRLSNAGLHRKDILENLHYVHHVSDVSMKNLYRSSFNPLNQSFIWKQSTTAHLYAHHESCLLDASQSEECETEYEERNFDECDNLKNSNAPPVPVIPQCTRLVSPPSGEEFFHEYVKKSRPFILQNATRNWPAFTRWTNEFLREKFGNKSVHIKMTPAGDYEGVERANRWEDFKTFKIPETVKKQLKYPDLVVVRPAGVNMKFSEFIDMINETAKLPISEREVSAYLEYTSVAEYFQVLEGDVIEPQFAKDLLTREHLNIWLSDGNTLGRLHFDPYDNLLCQLAGKKEVILFDPQDNEKLYEGHIPQAELSYDKETRKFRRKTLQDSTALVMSPVDIRNPDLQRFPKFLDAHPLNCTIEEGDILFMPSFWWHEVKSSPSANKPRNLAVNFWYEPFLTKEFPCEECLLDVNPAYFDKLD